MAGLRFLTLLVVPALGCASAWTLPIPSTRFREGPPASVPVAAETSPPSAGVPSSRATERPASVPDSPTWTLIYARYFGRGSAGACAQAGRCHAGTMADANSAYEWLKQRGYISGTQSALVSRTNSCLRWFGGNMPPRGFSNDDATRDLEAWVAAGAPEK
jgi:hypothetical protein